MNEAATSLVNERDLLRETLYGVHSHAHLLHALEGLAPEHAGAALPGSPHTIFQVLHHMVYWQDIALARMRDEDPPFPASAAEGWDFPRAPEDASDWEAAVASLAEGLRSMEAIVADEGQDLARTFGRQGQTFLAELLMIAGHNSYHLGQIVQLRTQLGAWPPPKGGDTW